MRKGTQKQIVRRVDSCSVLKSKIHNYSTKKKSAHLSRWTISKIDRAIYPFRPILKPSTSLPSMGNTYHCSVYELLTADLYRSPVPPVQLQ